MPGPAETTSLNQYENRAPREVKGLNETRLAEKMTGTGCTLLMEDYFVHREGKQKSLKDAVPSAGQGGAWGEHGVKEGASYQAS